MKRWIGVLVVVLLFGMASVCAAAPFVVCDLYPTTATQPDGFTVVVDNGASVDSTAQAVTGGVRLYYDVGGVSVGSHTMRVKAYKVDAVWGRLESEEAVFTFVKPAVPARPTGIGLSTN